MPKMKTRITQVCARMCVRAFAHRIAVVITSDILVVRTKQVHAEIIRFGRQSGRHYFGLGLAIVFVDK